MLVFLKRIMKVFRNIAVVLVVLIAVSLTTICITYNIQVSPVDKNDKTEIEIVIPSGATTAKVGEILEEHELIRSSTFFNIYTKLFEVNSIKASTYFLSKSMDLKTIVEIIEKGNSYNPNQIQITFKEGINIREVATLIAKNTNNKYEDVLSLVNNKEYLNELKKNYWFIEDDITNEKLYYSLEGYLFPDTYYFNNEDVSIKEIFKKMLDKMNNVLSEYKEEIGDSFCKTF